MSNNNLTLDDSSPDIIYSSNWAPQSFSNDLNTDKFFQSTYHSAQSSGATANISFTGMATLHPPLMRYISSISPAQAQRCICMEHRDRDTFVPEVLLRYLPHTESLCRETTPYKSITLSEICRPTRSRRDINSCSSHISLMTVHTFCRLLL